MSRKIYNRLSFMAVSWLDESTLGGGVKRLPFFSAWYIFLASKRPTGG